MSAQGQRFALIAGVMLITLATWYGVLAGSFQYDDYPNVIQDAATSDPGVFWHRLTSGFRPLLRASYFLDYTLWGMHAPGFLATNLTLHLVAVLAVFLLARRRLGGDFAAAVAAITFAVQPAHAEVIAYVSGRSTGLMATLLLLALLCYERSLPWRMGAVALWLCALLVKETALVFPALLVVWEITRPSARPGAGKRLLPFLAAGLVFSLGVLAVPRIQELLAFSLALRSPLQSLAWNAIAVPETLSLWLRPWALSIEHAPPVWTVFPALAGGALLLTLAALAVLLRRRTPNFAFAILFPLAALLPTHSIVAKLDPITEKPLYLAWVGVALLAGAVAARHARNPAVLGALGVTVLSGMIWSAKRVEVWQNPVLLWTEAVTEAPQSARAWNNLGMAKFNAEDLTGADAAFARALELDPRLLQAYETRLIIHLLQETGREPPAMEPQ